MNSDATVRLLWSLVIVMMLAIPAIKYWPVTLLLFACMASQPACRCCSS